MDETGKFFIVYLAGATGIWKGIPAGIALNLQPVLTGLYTALGSITSVLILFFAGDSFQQWVLRKYGKKRIEKKKGRFMDLTNRYGTWGIGLITTGLLGPFTTLFLGLVLIKDTRRFLLYLILGIFIWSFVLSYFFTPLVNLIAQITTDRN